MTQNFVISDQARALAAQVPEAVVKRLHLAVDADRTLTRSDKTVSSAMQAAIQAVYEVGGQIHLCTGRQYSVLRDSLMRFFPADARHVIAGGAGIVTTTGEVLWEHAMSGKLVWQLIQEAKRNGCLYAFSIGRTIYASAEMHAGLMKSYGNVLFGEVSELETLLQTQSVMALFMKNLTPTMLETLANHTSEISYKEMANYERERYVDITAKGVNKASGLEQFAKLQQLPVSEIITVGDENNDMEMIQVGWGVAMGNAIPALKAAARLTIGQTDDDGLAQFVMALIERRQQLS